MKQPGIQVNPIGQITGQYEFNEVVFTDFFVPDDHVLGEIDGAWKQATFELAYERSGPERFLETYYVLTELVRAVGTTRIPAAPRVSGAWSRRSTPCGACRFRWRACCRPARSRWSKPPSSRTSARCGNSNCRTGFAISPPLSRLTPPITRRWRTRLDFAIKTAPKLTIQGGTTEVLRGIIARGLGLRLARWPERR